MVAPATQFAGTSIFIHTETYKFRQEESSFNYYQSKNSVSSWCAEGQCWLPNMQV